MPEDARLARHAERVDRAQAVDDLDAGMCFRELGDLLDEDARFLQRLLLGRRLDCQWDRGERLAPIVVGADPAEVDVEAAHRLASSRCTWAIASPQATPSSQRLCKPAIVTMPSRIASAIA